MKRMLITGDWHLDEVPINKYRWDIFPFVVDLILKEKIDTLVFLGDLTERKDRHSSVLVNSIVSYFKEIAKIVDRIIFVCGNHDRILSNDPFFKFLSYLERNIIFVDDVLSLDRYLFVGYKKDEDFLEIVKSLDGEILFMHQQISGLVGSNIELPGGIPLESLSKFKRVYSGHIHQYMQIGNLQYVGSPFVIDFGEEDGYLILLDEERERKIKMPAVRKHSITLESYKDIIRYEFKEGDLLKLKLLCRRNSEALVIRDKVIDYVTSRGGVVVSFEILYEDENPDKGLSKVEEKDAVSILRDYCKEKNVDEEYYEIARKILEEEI